MPQATNHNSLGKHLFVRSALGSGILGALFAATANAQLPTLPSPPSYPQTAVANSPTTTPATGRLQVYSVPSEYIGSIGAQLQIQYHDQGNVQVTTDPKTGQLLVLAPEAVHQQIGAAVTAFMQQNNIQPGDRGMRVASDREQAYALRNLSWRELEDALHRLAGPQLTVTLERNGELAIFRMPNAAGFEDVLQVDRRLNQVTLLGTGPSVVGWTQVVYSLDQGQADASVMTHVVPVAPAEPRRVRRAIQLVNATIQDAGTDQAEAHIPLDGDEPAAAIGTLDDLSAQSGLFGDVQIEFVDDIGLVIIRGSKRDVQRVLEVIEKIKASAKETQPEVDVYPLQHANAGCRRTGNRSVREHFRTAAGFGQHHSFGTTQLFAVDRPQGSSRIRQAIGK